MNSRFFINVISIAVFVSSGIILSGCASQPVTPTAIDTVMKNEFIGAPDWVTKDCASYIKDNKKICGVGSIGGTRNPSIARTTAVARARTEIARNLQTRVLAMLKDYQATTSGGEYFGKYASDEQQCSRCFQTNYQHDYIRHCTEEIWVSKNGIYYVLVTLDTEKFKNIVQNMHSLPESVRKAVVQRADKAFGELDREIDKQKEN